MIIKVTQEHIRKGLRGRALFCPVALAIREATGREVAVTSIGCTMDYKYHTFENNDVSRFVCAFDNGDEVFPMEFEIDL